MMGFSDESLFRNAGHDEIDYVVVKWLASCDVEDYLLALPSIAFGFSDRYRVYVVEHQTDNSVGYVPNLRAMMNDGFTLGFNLNEYCGLTNTDVYHGPGWLSGLVRYVAPWRIINSLHITASSPPHPVAGIITENLGVPEPGTFNLPRFMEIYRERYRDESISSVKMSSVGGYRQCATMPYLFHRRYWESCGPWELTLENGTPDVRFFDRVSAAGAEFMLSYASIIYHHEAVERRRHRPRGAEGMREE